MSFTRQQILEIQQKLVSLGYKDTDFRVYTDVNGDEYVAIVANGENRRILLRDLESHIISDGIPDLELIRRGAARGRTAYQKPASGIPKSHLSGGVQQSLTKADLAYSNMITETERNSWNDKEDKSNKVDEITNESTDTQYPSAGAVYRYVKNNKQTVSYGTTEEWNSRIGYVPAAGEIVVYNDHASKEVDGQTIFIPGIKIGGGNGYVQDLAFVGDDIAEQLMAHINNNVRHITDAERDFWNNKINVDDEEEVVGEVLIFNRN